jgi:hypothetical protein
MPRAHSIFICRLIHTPIKILGSWTVKHEMVHWLNTCGLRLRDIEVVRMHDSQPNRGMTTVPIGELLK